MSLRQGCPWLNWGPKQSFIFRPPHSKMTISHDQMNSLFQQLNKTFTDDMVFDGPCDSLGAGLVTPLATNVSIEPVMTRNPSYKQIIKICFGLNGKLHNEINVNTSLILIKIQLMQIRLQLIIIFNII